MSGPMAATYSLEAALIAAAIEAMQGAAEVAAGYREERRRQAELADHRQQEASERRQATLAARLAIRNEISAVAARWRQLSIAHAALGGEAGLTPPAQSTADDLADPQAMSGLLAQWQAANAALEAEVARLSATALAEAAPDVSQLIAAATDIDSQLAAFEAQAALTASLPEPLLAERKALVARLLARRQAGSTMALSEATERLVAELLRTASAERAEALASELRRQIESDNQTAATEAAALVLEQSLRDLGYEVDGITETLFVEGGVAHFQKPGWNDYFVRIRVDVARTALNFNVVRPGAAGDDRRREDMLAEERWCAEFPVLQKTLAARGLKVAVSRMLAAGEVPVQVVDAATLPAWSNEEDRRTGANLKAMHRP